MRNEELRPTLARISYEFLVLSAHPPSRAFKTADVRSAVSFIVVHASRGCLKKPRRRTQYVFSNSVANDHVLRIQL